MKLNRTQIKTVVDIIYTKIFEENSANVALLKQQTVDKFKKSPIYKKIEEVNNFLVSFGVSKAVGEYTIESVALKYYEIKLPKLNSNLVKIQIENKLVLKTIGSDIDITSIIEQIKTELTNG